MGTEPKHFSPEGNDHPTARDIGEWLGGGSPAAAYDRIRQHFIHCAECREDMVMIRQATQAQREIEQSQDFERLLRLGERAAREAFDQYGRPRESRPARPVAPAKSPRRWEWLPRWQPLYGWAAVALLALAVALPVYWVWRGNQPVDRAMASLRQAWRDNRPIESRVTGDFPYLPYQVTRGSNDTNSVNQDQLLVAMAELAREVADRPTVRSRQALGRLHLLKSEYEKAEEQFNAAIKEDPQNSLVYVDLAASLYQRGTLEQSVPLLAQAAEQCQKAIALSPRLPEAWFNQALIHEQMQLPAKAISGWEKYLEIDATSPWAGEARSRLQKLRERAALRPPEQNVLSDALLAADATGDEPQIQGLLANHFSEISDLLTNRLLDEYLAARINGDEARSKQYGGVISRLAQRIKQEKDEYFFVDLFNYVERADPKRLRQVQELRSELRHAATNAGQGRLDQAVALYSQVWAKAQQIADVCHGELAISRLALLLNTRYIERPEMPPLRKQLRNETADRRHRQLHALALIADTNLYLADQKFFSALSASSQAYEISRQLGDLNAVTNALRFLGGIYSKIGDYETGISKNMASLQTFWDQPPSANRACQIYTQMAEGLAEDRFHFCALDYQLEALRYCRMTSNQMLAISSSARTSSLYALTGNTSETIRLLNEAIALAEIYSDDTGVALLNPDLYLSLGDTFYKQGALNKAEVAYRKVLQTIGDHNAYNRSALHHGLARIYLKQNQEEAAEKEFLKSIDLIEQAYKDFGKGVLRGTFLDDKSNVYRSMVNFQAANKADFAQAFNYAEKHRSGELLASLSGMGNMPPRSSTGLLSYSKKVTALQLPQVQSLLPGNAQLVEYAIMEDTLLIWVVTVTHWTTVRVPITSEQLQRQVSAYLKQLPDRDERSALDTTSTELYRVLIEPVARMLDKQRILIIVPDEFLNSLPFAALVMPESQHYLVEEYTLVVNPSASVTVKMLEKGTKRKSDRALSLLCLSNPRFDAKHYPSLKPLPRTEAEATGIQSFYPVNMNLTKTEATRGRLLKFMGNYEIVHLATHSVINERNPMLSSIILARDEQSEWVKSGSSRDTADDSLSAEQIFNLRLDHTRLVILSSCRSASKALLRDKGLGGLAHAFFSAGVPTVIASLWEVDDDSTSELMKEFHRTHRLEKKSFSQALQQAQLSMLHSANLQWRHPYYWAAFLVSGDGLAA